MLGVLTLVLLLLLLLLLVGVSDMGVQNSGDMKLSCPGVATPNMEKVGVGGMVEPNDEFTAQG